MDRNVLGYPVEAGSPGRSLDQQRVLRNTYWLLALSMLPTVLGAWVGLSTGLLLAMGPGMSFIVFMVGSIGLMMAIDRTKNSSTGVVMLLAFTFFMGLMLSRLLGLVLGFSNGSQLIMTAFLGTAGVFFGMATLATVVKKDLSGLSRFLWVGMWIMIAAIVINLFMHSSAMMLMISVGVMAIFSLYIMVDVKRVLDGGETNYVMATLNIYIDLYNVFQSLLMLLTAFGGNSRD
jgi:modulator of FtsH protease